MFSKVVCYKGRCQMSHVSAKGFKFSRPADLLYVGKVERSAANVSVWNEESVKKGSLNQYMH